MLSITIFIISATSVYVNSVISSIIDKQFNIFYYSCSSDGKIIYLSLKNLDYKNNILGSEILISINDVYYESNYTDLKIYPNKIGNIQLSNYNNIKFETKNILRIPRNNISPIKISISC